MNCGHLFDNVKITLTPLPQIATAKETGEVPPPTCSTEHSTDTERSTESPLSTTVTGPVLALLEDGDASDVIRLPGDPAGRGVLRDVIPRGVFTFSTEHRAPSRRPAGSSVDPKGSW